MGRRQRSSCYERGRIKRPTHRRRAGNAGRARRHTSAELKSGGRVFRDRRGYSSRRRVQGTCGNNQTGERGRIMTYADKMTRKDASLKRKTERRIEWAVTPPRLAARTATATP